ncbi:MAG: ECF transporter S component [Synergistaceae bacterium]|jgi:uncharacterized membrane protein|nr:ECF transporter S component [Synergistaceae bacterium]
MKLKNMTEETSAKIRDLSVTSLFAAIILLMAFTPVGFINLVFINATIIHVPVAIGSVILGPRKGAVLGAIFGFTSLIINSMHPKLLSFAFSPVVTVPGTQWGSLWALVICFVPRILVGVVPWYVDKFLSSLRKGDKKWRVVSLLFAGIAGSITNTILVMHLIYFLFQDAYATVGNVGTGAVYGLVLSVIIANGIPEAAVAGVLTPAICKAIERFRRR